MTKFFDTFANTISDGPAVSSLATIAVDWHAGGWLGLAFNGSGAGLCFGTRLLAECGYAFNPKTPMLVQALYTTCAGLVTYNYTGFSSETLILGCAVIGNVLSALQEKTIRTSVGNFFKKAAGIANKAPSDRPPSRTHSALRTAGTVLAEPNVYWTAALCKATQSVAAMPFYILGGSVSFAQPIFHDGAARFLATAQQERAKMKSKFAAAKTNICSRAVQGAWFAAKNRSARVMIKKDVGLKLFALASAIGAGQNLFFAGNPRIAMAAVCYGLTALSIYAYNTYGGVSQALRSSRQQRRELAHAMC